MRPHFAVYITPELRDGGTPGWVLLDVWLTYPIWKGGSIAPLAFRALRFVAITIYLVVTISG